MPFNGNGVFVRVYSWQNDANNGIPITASRMDTETNGIATGLSTCITKDGQTTITADLPMAGFRHTGVGDASARAQYLSLGQYQDGGTVWGGTAGGSANAITVNLTPGVPALVTGMEVSFIAASANTNAVTLSINGLTAKAVTKNGATALVANDILAGALIVVQYDGTQFQLISKSDSAQGGLTSNNTWTGTNTYQNAVNLYKGTDIASASTVNIGAANGNFIDITGTTTITAFDAVQAGTTRTVRFTGILTLTHNGTSLILPNGANITTIAGDVATFVSLGSGNWVCVNYRTVNGLIPAQASNSGKYLTTNGTSLSWGTVAQVIDLIAVLTPSGASEIVRIGLTSSYAEYRFVFQGLDFSADCTFNVAFSNDNGSTYKTTAAAYVYAINSRFLTDGQNDTSASSTQIALNSPAPVIGGDTGEQFNASVRLRNHAGVTNKTIIEADTDYFNANGNFGGGFVRGVEAAAMAVDAIRFQPSTGTVTGTVYIYGLRSS